MLCFLLMSMLFDACQGCNGTAPAVQTISPDNQAIFQKHAGALKIDHKPIGNL